MRSFIIPVDHHASILEALLEEFLRYHELDISKLIKPYTDKEGARIVQALVDDILNQRMEWAKASYHTETVLEEVFPEYSSEAHRYSDTLFYDDVVLPVENALRELLDNLVPTRTWKIWHTKLLVRDVVLEEGEDYRIADWTSRFERGEITLDD